MLYPRTVAATTAIHHRGTVTVPGAIHSASPIGECRCLRVAMEGGHYFDAPATALIEIPHRLRVDRLRSGMTLHAPARNMDPPTRDIPYKYLANNNAGKPITYQGKFRPTDEEAELLGWLVGDGTINSPKQSIRFSNSDVWVLNHVQYLVETAFPDVTVKWYAKNAGFDILLTGGIHNPLRAFLRQHKFVEGWPTSLSYYGERARVAFLKGFWGANGWLSIRKGGNDVDLGLSRSTNSAFTSMVRLFHAMFGLQGQRRDCPTKKCPNKHRLVFSGYRNYATYFERIGSLRNRDMATPPVRRPRATPPTLIVQQTLSYEARIARITRLPEPIPCYEMTDVGL